MSRIGVKGAASILGGSVRTIQAAAARGAIPSAAKPFGSWTFDEPTLRAWMRSREDEIWQRNENQLRAATGAARHSGAASRSRVGKSGLAYEQMSKGC